jgi:glucose uptake protein GlcU
MKNAGVIVIILGALMFVYTGFNFVTKEKVADFGGIEIKREKNHPVEWSPVIGAVLIVAGVTMLVINKKNA